MAQRGAGNHPGAANRFGPRSPAVGLLLGAGLGWVGLATPARADTAHLQRARELYQELHYDTAYPAFREALVSPGNRPEEIAEIYLHLGMLAAMTGNSEEAEDHFVHLLVIRPDAQLPGALPPKITRPFSAARAKAKTLEPFRLSHTTLSVLPAGGGLELKAQLEPDELGMATAVTLRYRAADASEYASLRKQGSGTLVFTVSASELPAGQDVDYYFEVNDAYGGVLWEFGAARSPIHVTTQDQSAAAVAAAEDDGFWADNWQWVALGATGAAVVAVGTTVAVVAVVNATTATVESGPIEHEVAGLR